MKIVQILEAFGWGDAIGNHVQALDDLFAQAGARHEIYANAIDRRLADRARPIADYAPAKDDVILYHLSTGSDLNFSVADYPGKLVVNYHNITPSHFFAGYNERAVASCNQGREGLAFLATHTDLAIADSAYNASELREAGYACDVVVAPVLLNMSHLGAPHALDITPPRASRATDAPLKLLFVGRTAPNKRLERVIEDFYYVKKFVDPHATLQFVGNPGGMESYLLRLRKYVRRLRLPDVEFLGHVQLDEMINAYRTADVFVCESAHEGFCVPLVEAMHFGVPVVAQDTSAVGDTLGNGGLLLTHDDPKEAAVAIDLVTRSEAVREKMAEGQREQLARFDGTRVAHDFLAFLGL